VLDTGVDADHPDIDLASDGWVEFDASGERLDTEPHDPSGHGTHVTGVVAGGNASGRYVGVAPEARLLHGKVLDDGGTFAQITAGIEWALERDADVISMSFGIPANGDSVHEEAFIEPIRTASEAEAVVVTSSGNTGQGATGSSGNVYDAVAVGAVVRARTLSFARFSLANALSRPLFCGARPFRARILSFARENSGLRAKTVVCTSKARLLRLLRSKDRISAGFTRELPF